MSNGELEEVRIKKEMRILQHKARCSKEGRQPYRREMSRMSM